MGNNRAPKSPVGRNGKKKYHQGFYTIQNVGKYTKYIPYRPDCKSKYRTNNHGNARYQRYRDVRDVRKGQYVRDVRKYRYTTPPFLV